MIQIWSTVMKYCRLYRFFFTTCFSIILMVLAGCQSASIQPMNSSGENILQDEMLQEENKDLLQNARVEIVISQDGRISIPIKQIPDLYEYISQSSDPQLEIERIRTWWIGLVNKAEYFMIGYGCGNKQCELTLARIKYENLELLKMPNAIYQGEKVSPDESKIVFQFGYNEGTVNRSFLIVVDTNLFIKKTAELDPHLPILDYKWIDEQTLAYSVPDVPSTDYESIIEWNASAEKKVVDVIINFD